jgi:thiamine kinase-like enzyme
MSPEEIITNIPDLASQTILSIAQFTDGHSNQSFLVSTTKSKYVLRLDGEAQKIFQCCREFELEVLKQASCSGISVKPVYSDIKKGLLLYTYREGSPLTLQQLSDSSIQKQLYQLTDTVASFVTPTAPQQLLLAEQLLDPQLPKFHRLNEIIQSLQPLIQQLKQFSNENCLCHNDLSPGNLLIGNDGKLFALDWEYAANNHPLLDFAFFANSFNINDAVLQQHYPQSISHKEIDFSEMRRLGWFIEAIWYAKRHQFNPDNRWKLLLEQTLSKL